jgi:hypothetical protein
MTTANDDVVALARELRGWLDREMCGGNLYAAVGPLERPDVELWNCWPDARAFGRSVLWAAACPIVPAGLCRYCLARSHAIGTSEPPTSMSASAVSVMLGEPCTKCGRRLRVARNAITASAARPNLHSAVKRPCTICHAWKQSARQALRASGELPTLKPHKARPAAFGPVRIVLPPIHNGTGALANCGCKECRGARIIRYDANVGRYGSKVGAR